MKPQDIKLINIVTKPDLKIIVVINGGKKVEIGIEEICKYLSLELEGT